MKSPFFLAFLLLAGCASNSGVMPIGKETFMISRQAATGFSGSGTLKAEAFAEANRYCTSLGKSVQVINTHEASPPYILGNFPKAEIQFMCLEANDAELVRPKLRKDADTVIQVKNDIRVKDEVAKSKDIYAELLKLDDLRKKGIISEQEFIAQKQKLLSQN
jgi:hypothetical protein